MALKLSLKPGEQFILNGAVLRNGDRRTSLLLENKARILREKDIMVPKDVGTPEERAYFAIMQMYVLDAVSGPAYDRAAQALSDLLLALPGREDRTRVLEISANLVAGRLYPALSGCRALTRRYGKTPASEVA